MAPEDTLDAAEGAPDGPPAEISFPPELPISARVQDIALAVAEHPVVIVAGATGSGKTTQLPKIALAMGRGLEQRIGVTQPRRIAATSVAARVASELGSPLGQDVGYQIRFEDKTSPRTYVKFMTDGILLAEIQTDPLLRRYDTLILDEAHERSLTIDFLLGWVKRILPSRPDLKVIVSSATLETERFSEFFGGAPVIQVEGRTFPVEVLYEPPLEEVDLPTAVANAVENITSLDPRGDVLVFLPGEREIRETENELASRRLRHTVILPLYARLSGAEQGRVFSTLPERRVILATNVAETSVTIPGIVYVVDTGIARLSRYEPRSGTTRLQIEGVSQASADQRKGRCGRVREGICVRLYDEASFEARPAYTDPEIKRTGLAAVILRMKALGLGDVDGFPFIDPPSSKAIAEGYRVLEELGALDDARELTPVGRRLARFPVDPRIGRMILAGAELGCLRETLVIAAALNIQDPRERPREHQQKADDLHRRFRDERSDFVGLLRLWEFVREAEAKGTGHLRRACKESFLSFLRVREWGEIVRQLEDVTRELGLARDERAPREGRRNREAVSVEVGDRLHRALLTGLLSKIGKWNPETRTYMGAKQTRFALHPSSYLAKKPPAWVMAFELVETSQLFARMVAKIEPEWLIEAGPHLLKRSYSDPHWSEKSARASVKEHVTLFGLTVSRDRSVDYASVAPSLARAMFLDHALVRGEYTSRGSFARHNAELLAEVARLRDKARKSDMLRDDDALLSFFDAKVPADVVNGKTFEAWREEAERAEPNLLRLTLDDVLLGEGLSEKSYPDVITLHGVKLPLRYVFDPSRDDDGITVTVPLALVPQLDPGELDWTIPGWHEEKILALLYEVPRASRRELGDLPALARTLARRLTPFGGSMTAKLAEAVEDETGVRLPPDALRLDVVAAYLRVTCELQDERGHVVDAGRDVGRLLAKHGARAKAALAAAPAASNAWEKKGLTAWTFGDVPPFVRRLVGGAFGKGNEVRSYPAIEDRGASVDLVLAESQSAAESLSRAGVRRLLMIGAKGAISSVAPRLPGPFAKASGAPHARAESEAFRALVLARIADMAFGLEGEVDVPKSKASFDAMLAFGAPRVNGAFKLFSDALVPVSRELDATHALLRKTASQPSGRIALVEIQNQIALLFPDDLLAWIPLATLAHYPRYLKAAQARLLRAVTDPRKDEGKLAPLSPLWNQFLAMKHDVRTSREARDVRFLFEEWRVAIFAPELRTPAPVSAAKVQASLAALRGPTARGGRVSST